MYAGRPLLLMTVDHPLQRMLFCRDAVESSAVSHALASLVRVASSYRPRPSRTTASSVAPICRTEMDRRRHHRFGTTLGLSEDSDKINPKGVQTCGLAPAAWRYFTAIRRASSKKGALESITVSDVHRLNRFERR